MPLYQDSATPEFLAGTNDDSGTVVEGESESQGGLKVEIETKSTDGRPDIAMDAMAFGMGMCCTQITFQVRWIRSFVEL